MTPALVILLLGVLHFAIGGLWYSMPGFGRIWMQGLGITEADIREARINTRAALAVSATASLAQTAAIVWILVMVPTPSWQLAITLPAALAFAFAFLPMLKDQVWADRPWPVILVDAGYEILSAALVGALAMWFLE
jgi:hypothetical protein